MGITHVKTYLYEIYTIIYLMKITNYKELI
jgi:hypothetical protein